jgi:DNA-binding beta-propeller fold protein YncE
VNGRDEDANEIFIADGYLNRRVIVFDTKTGEFKRGWGAYGKPISEISNDSQPAHDPNDLHAADFKSPVHCVRISNDGLVYVCDRAGDRVQVFTKQGKFLKEFPVANATMGGGSVGSVDFSSDPMQKYIFIADLVNATVWQLDRQSGKILGHVSHKGTNPGELFAPHAAAMDSKGSVYMSAKSDAARACRNSCRQPRTNSGNAESCWRNDAQIILHIDLGAGTGGRLCGRERPQMGLSCRAAARQQRGRNAAFQARQPSPDRCHIYRAPENAGSGCQG